MIFGGGGGGGKVFKLKFFCVFLPSPLFFCGALFFVGMFFGGGGGGCVENVIELKISCDFL